MHAQSRYPAFVNWKDSTDRREGAAAFAEKRTPSWQNR
jgi:hypothetical protein